MTTELDAINTMLSCIGQAPLNTLQGTKSSFVISALNILKDETINFQMRGWDFNTEEDYPLVPDINNEIHVPNNLVKIKIDSLISNRYVIRSNRIYDKYKHTFKIYDILSANVTFALEFDELPEAARNYIKMSAANKFVKRELGTQSSVQYTLQDFAEASQILLEHELEIGQYTLIPEYYDNSIKRGLF